MSETNNNARGVQRRTFLKVAGLGATGFALAVGPISAKTIHTSDKGLVTRDEEIPSGADKIPVYLAMPQGKGPFPTVVVVHEVFGLHEHIRDVARRFAHAGFLALAPELFFRQGGTKHLPDFATVIKVVLKAPDDQIITDLKAVVQHGAKLPQSNGKVGMTGFCWGGRFVWLMAALDQRLAAGVAWYGRLHKWGQRPIQKESPLDLAEQIKAPVLGLYGGKDTQIPLMFVEEMRDELTDLGTPHEFVIFPQAPHAFHADYRANYREEEAKEGWQRCIAWFKKYLA